MPGPTGDGSASPVESERRRVSGRHGFWPLALLWLPAGFVASALLRFGWPAEPDSWLLMSAGSLAVVAPCGLPLALACRALWRQGYRVSAWSAGVGLGALTVAAGLFAGLLGPVAIAVAAIVPSLPVWAAWWLVRRSREG